MRRTFYKRELVISSRAHLPTWLPRTQRSRLVPAAILESRMSVGTQRDGHAFALRIPPGTAPICSRNLSHLEDVDGEAFQVSLSVSSSEPPTHLLLRSKSLISRRSSDRRRKHPLHLHWTSTTSTTRTFRGLRAYHSLSFSRVHVNTHTLHAVGSAAGFLSVALPILLRSRPVSRERSNARDDDALPRSVP